jgi:hypothetical protein
VHESCRGGVVTTVGNGVEPAEIVSIAAFCVRYVVGNEAALLASGLKNLDVI